MIQVNYLVEDEHRVEPVEGGGVKVLDLATGQASQASEVGRKVSRLHLSYNSTFFSLKPLTTFLSEGQTRTDCCLAVQNAISILCKDLFEDLIAFASYI